MVAKSDNKSKALELAISQVDKQFGKGSIMRLAADGPVMSTNSISTGCLSIASKSTGVCKTAKSTTVRVMSS